MLKYFQVKWQVGQTKLILILLTFIFGGSCCGYVGKKVISLFPLDPGIPKTLLYLLIVTLLWPICVIAISIPLGQFVFFKKYIVKIFKRFSSIFN